MRERRGGRGVVAGVVALLGVAACDGGGGGVAVAPTLPGLAPADVSILLPLPETLGELDALWPLDLPARGGALVPQAAIDAVPRAAAGSLSLFIGTRAEADAATRVVSVRLDPCFRRRLEDPCEPQIRLVFQVIAPEERLRSDAPAPPEAEVMAFDGALHAFYAIPAAEAPAFIAQVRALAALGGRANADAPALGVSPALRANGMDSAYGRALTALVARYAGDATLVRLAFMHVIAPDLWFFSAQERDRDGVWQHLDIAGLGDDLEELRLVADPTVPSVFDFAAGAPPDLEETFFAALSSRTLAELDEGTRRALFADLVTLTDPTRLAADESSCLSCHVTKHALGWLVANTDLQQRKGVDWSPRVLGDQDANPFNLRMFGYFQRAPSVSQRVANETRAIVGR